MAKKSLEDKKNMSKLKFRHISNIDLAIIANQKWMIEDIRLKASIELMDRFNRYESLRINSVAKWN